MLPFEALPSADELKCKEGQSYYASSYNNIMTNPRAISTGDTNICIKAFTKDAEKMWNFTDSKFKNIGNVTSQKEFDGLFLNGSEYIPIKSEGNIKYLNGWNYKNALVLDEKANGANSSEGTIEVDLDGPSEIYISAKSNSDATSVKSELHIYNQNGKEILPESNPISKNIENVTSFANGPDVKKYVYGENVPNKIRISTGNAKMKIFSIATKKLKEKDNTVVDEYYDITKNGDNYGLKFTDDIRVKSTNANNEYGIYFKQYANLRRKGTIYTNNIKMYTPSNTDIYISARTTGDEYKDERQLILVNKFGYLIGYVNAVDNNEVTSNVHPGTDKLIGSNKKILTFHFAYIGDSFNGEDLYIMSADSGIDIYDVRIKTRKEFEPGIDKNLDIKFSDKFFDDYVGSIENDIEYNDICKISATPDKPVKIVKDPAMGDSEYSRYLVFGGHGASDYRNIKFKVNGKVHISLLVNHNGLSYENRELDLFDENGYIWAYAELVGQDIYEVNFDYTGGENTLYLRSKINNMQIYSVKVTDWSSSDIGSSMDLTMANKENSTNNVESGSAISSNNSIKNIEDLQNDEVSYESMNFDIEDIFDIIDNAVTEVIESLV